MKNFINKIFNYINKIADVRKDLLIHGGVSAFLVVLICNLFMLCNNSTISLAIAIVMTSIFGVCKEYMIDKYIRNSMPDKSDLIADFVGICVGTICCVPLLFQ